MPISLYWDDDARTIIRRDHIGEWTLAEVEQSTYDIETLAKSVQHTFHLIFNFTDSTSFSAKILAAARGADQTILPNQGLVVGVKMAAYLQALAYIAGKAYPKLARNTFYVDTIDAARALIAEYKATHE
jgi:hypothetical protein